MRIRDFHLRLTGELVYPLSVYLNLFTKRLFRHCVILAAAGFGSVMKNYDFFISVSVGNNRHNINILAVIPSVKSGKYSPVPLPANTLTS